MRDRPARPPIDVNSGRGFMFIDHTGKVYPSGFLPHVAGDVRTTSVAEIYRSAPIMRQLRSPDTFGGKRLDALTSARAGTSRSAAR